jgi:hypothetical protein
MDGGGPHDDIGTLEPDPEPVEAAAPPGPDPVPDYEPGPVLPDPPPAHGRREWRKGKGGPKAPRAKPSKVTAGIRNDIDAKISFALEIPARVWEARDPVCGGTFVEQRPEISAALTEIVCQSPDLIAWFAGGGGQFMLYLNLMAAFWPVVTVAMAHHVYHSIEAGEPEAEPDGIRYAA